MTDRDKVQLLFGPFRPPPLRKGDRVFCLFRDGVVVVTSWSAAPIIWPRCRALGTHGGGSGLLLDEELARAVRHESSAAIQHHWGVTEGVVWRWRKSLGVSQWGTQGSERLHRRTSRAGADAVKRREFTEAERAQRRRTARRLNTARHLRTGYHGPRWTPEQLALLGVLRDDEVAQRVKRTANAVRLKREALGIANAAGQGAAVDGRRRRVRPHPCAGGGGEPHRADHPGRLRPQARAGAAEGAQAMRFSLLALALLGLASLGGAFLVTPVAWLAARRIDRKRPPQEWRRREVAGRHTLAGSTAPTL